MTREVEKVASAYFDLGGVTALITGGASGLGKATADRMLRSNANVVIADYSDAGQQVADELDAKYDMSCKFIKTDVSKEEDIKAAVDYAVSCFGSLDILVASAGIGGANNAIADETLANWEKVNAVDYTGVMLADKYAIMQFLKQGHGGAICNLASMFGLVAVPSNVAYSAAKGGVVNLTKSAGTAYASHGIHQHSAGSRGGKGKIPRNPPHAPHRRGLRDCLHHHLPLQPECPLHHRRGHPGRRRIHQCLMRMHCPHRPFPYAQRRTRRRQVFPSAPRSGLFRFLLIFYPLFAHLQIEILSLDGIFMGIIRAFSHQLPAVPEHRDIFFSVHGSGMIFLQRIHEIVVERLGAFFR